MANEPAIYDLTLLLDSGVEVERREKILADVEALVERQGGELLGRHDWGVRPTAYEVGRRPEADYHLFQFHATNELLEALDHALKITDGVSRFRIIKLRRGTPPPPDLGQAAVAAAAVESED